MNPNRNWVLTDCPKSLIEAVSLQTILFNLGIPFSDIYFLISNNDIGIVLRSQGKEVAFRIGNQEFDTPLMLQSWEKLIKQWNTGGSLANADKDAILFGSNVIKHTPAIVLKLVQQGFSLDPQKTHIAVAKRIERN